LVVAEDYAGYGEILEQQQQRIRELEAALAAAGYGEEAVPVVAWFARNGRPSAIHERSDDPAMTMCGRVVPSDAYAYFETWAHARRIGATPCGRCWRKEAGGG
jgi:hypothetical protein